MAEEIRIRAIEESDYDAYRAMRLETSTMGRPGMGRMRQNDAGSELKKIKRQADQLLLRRWLDELARPLQALEP